MREGGGRGGAEGGQFGEDRGWEVGGFGGTEGVVFVEDQGFDLDLGVVRGVFGWWWFLVGVGGGGGGDCWTELFWEGGECWDC